MGQNVVVLGIGNLQCATTIIGALGTYFGERPIEVSLYDPDKERLSLFERFARVVFEANRANHDVFASDDLSEVLVDPWRIIISLDRNAAFKILRKNGLGSDPLPAHTCAITKALDLIVPTEISGAEVVSLLPPEIKINLPKYYRLPEPRELSSEEKVALPHQILRWIREDEYLFEFLKAEEFASLRNWLDNPEIAELVVTI